MIVVKERLQEAFQQFGWSRIPEILHTHAEEAAKHNSSYLEFLDKLLQEEIVTIRKRFRPHEDTDGSPAVPQNA